MVGERLAKFVAHSGAASRRKSEEIVRSGRVKVNGLLVTDPAHPVDPARDEVTLDGRSIRRAARQYYVALHKPAGYLSDLADSQGLTRRLARQLIKVEATLFPVGRLDYHSEGLMIFTNDGAFANRFIHPRYGVEREYHVKLTGRLNREEMGRMTAGVAVEGDLLRVRSIVPLRQTEKNAWYRVIVAEGKNRMIRRMAEALFHPVLRLRRVRIDGITLGGLKPGQYAFIEPRLIKEHVRQAAGVDERA
jgi:23S rRNA pseudouridine2605 synthase